MYADVVSCFNACNVAVTVVCDDESLINATSRKELVKRYNTLGNTLTEASGVQRPGAAGRIDNASDINLELSCVTAKETCRVWMNFQVKLYIIYKNVVGFFFKMGTSLYRH